MIMAKNKRAAILAIISFSLVGRDALALYDLPSDRKIVWSAGLDPVGGIPVYPSVTCSGLDGTGINDATSGINSCISNAAADTAVHLPAGVYKVTGNINLKSRVALRGAGSGPPYLPSTSSGTTTINMSGGHIVFDGGQKAANWTPSAPNGTPITSGYTRGSSSIIVGDAANYSVGDVISIYQNKDAAIIDDKGRTYLGEDYGSGDPHVLQQYSKVTAKNANTLTIDPPIHYVTPSPTGQSLRKQTFGLVLAGLEDLKINRAGSDVWLIYLRFTRNCWVKHVETYNAGNNGNGSPHIWTIFSYQNEYRDNYHHHGESRDSGRNYGIEFYNWNSAHKVENNIIRDTRHSIVFEGGGSGNVMTFNYTDDNGESVQGAGTTADTSFLGEDGISSHGAHPYMNLWEGNNMTSWWGDYTQGSSSHITAFRNYIRCKNTVQPLDANPWLWVCVEIETYNRYYNLIGNVIGLPSFTAGTVVSDNSGGAKPFIYRFGVSSAGGSYTDTQSYSTAIKHGNHDYVTDGVAHWDGGADHALGSSLYYSVRPSFWCSETPWPPIGPDKSPLASDIPAKRRYDGEVCTLSGSAPPPAPTAPSPPTGLSVQ